MANLSGQKCYGLARFGRQKAPVNRKYGHDTQGVAGSSPARPTEVPGQAYYYLLNFGKTSNVRYFVSNAVSNASVWSCQLSATRQQPVRLKNVEVREIISYVRTAFSTQ
jgi:hypothetical protein